jgi:phage shock protein C
MLKPAQLRSERISSMHASQAMNATPLYRSRSDRLLGGVCGGLARWLGWNATVVRILYVLLSICSAGFPGTLVYILLWMAMPADQR